MFREKIHDILKRIWKRRKEIEEEKDDVRCKDCNKPGHSTKRSSQCEHFASLSTNVGTKHKMPTEYEKIESKKQKLEAKREGIKGQLLENIAVCSSCHQNGPKSSRSKECPNHNLTKQEEVQALLGNHTSITRKIKLDTILKPAYKTLIKDKVRLVSDQIRNIMIRAQLFVNYYYIITHCDHTIDKRVFIQNFWYCITQLVLKKPPKNRKAMPDDCLTFWASFSSRYNVTYEITPVGGYSHCLTAACVETATV